MIDKNISEAYISLFMLDKKHQRLGIGKRIYSNIEKIFFIGNVAKIRIDVVKNYKDNKVLYWKSLGFK